MNKFFVSFVLTLFVLRCSFAAPVEASSTDAKSATPTASGNKPSSTDTKKVDGPKSAASPVEMDKARTHGLGYNLDNIMKSLRHKYQYSNIPAPSISPGHGVPYAPLAAAPSHSYGSSYGVPSYSYGSSSYGAPSYTYGSSYGVPSYSYGSSSYGAPSYSYGSSYGVPSFSYGSSSYGAPSYSSGSSYGPPSHSYGGSSYSYGAPSYLYGSYGASSYIHPASIVHTGPVAFPSAPTHPQTSVVHVPVTQTVTKPVFSYNPHVVQQPVYTVSQEVIHKPIYTEVLEVIRRPVITEVQEIIHKPVLTELQQTIKKPLYTQHVVKTPLYNSVKQEVLQHPLHVQGEQVHVVDKPISQIVHLPQQFLQPVASHVVHTPVYHHQTATQTSYVPAVISHPAPAPAPSPAPAVHIPTVSHIPPHPIPSAPAYGGLYGYDSSHLSGPDAYSFLTQASYCRANKGNCAKDAEGRDVIMTDGLTSTNVDSVQRPAPWFANSFGNQVMAPVSPHGNQYPSYPNFLFPSLNKNVIAGEPILQEGPQQPTKPNSDEARNPSAEETQEAEKIQNREPTDKNDDDDDVNEEILRKVADEVSKDKALHDALLNMFKDASKEKKARSAASTNADNDVDVDQVIKLIKESPEFKKEIKGILSAANDSKLQSAAAQVQTDKETAEKAT